MPPIIATLDGNEAVAVSAHRTNEVIAIEAGALIRPDLSGRRISKYFNPGATDRAR